MYGRSQSVPTEQDPNSGLQRRYSASRKGDKGISQPSAPPVEAYFRDVIVPEVLRKAPNSNYEPYSSLGGEVSPALPPTSQDNQEIMNYIEALKFDAAKDAEEALKQIEENANNNCVVEMLNKLKFRPGSCNNNNNEGQQRSCSKDNLYDTTGGEESSCEDLVHNYRSNSSVKKSQQELSCCSPNKEVARKKSGRKEESSGCTADVIRLWGKRPLLVATEPPWSPRNQMYFKAIKALNRGSAQARNSQGQGLRCGLPQAGCPPPQYQFQRSCQPPATCAAFTEEHSVRIPNGCMMPHAQQQQQQGMASRSMMPYYTDKVPASSTNHYYYQQQNIPLPLPKVPMMGSQQGPIPPHYLAAISGMSAQNTNKLPLAVAMESPFPRQQEFVGQSHQPQQMQQFQGQIFGRLDPKCMTLIPQQQPAPQQLHFQQQERQFQQIQYQMQQR